MSVSFKDINQIKTRSKYDNYISYIHGHTNYYVHCFISITREKCSESKKQSKSVNHSNRIFFISWWFKMICRKT